MFYIVLFSINQSTVGNLVSYLKLIFFISTMCFKNIPRNELQILSVYFKYKMNCNLVLIKMCNSFNNLYRDIGMFFIPTNLFKQ